MDKIYPTNVCNKQPIICTKDGSKSYTGGTWVSSSYIRNRGQTSFATQIYDEGWPNYLTNNPPPSLLYVRVAPSQYNKNKLVYWINGWERPRLILTLGKKYQFNVVTCGNPFFLTTDPNGGNGDIGNVSSVNASDYFVTTITVTEDLPKSFYYQSSKNSEMGGQVIIKINQNDGY